MVGELTGDEQDRKIEMMLAPSNLALYRTRNARAVQIFSGDHELKGCITRGRLCNRVPVWYKITAMGKFKEIFSPQALILR